MAQVQGVTPMERAINRAMAEGLTAVRTGAQTFAVASASTPGVSYTVTIEAPGKGRCDCKGGNHEQCKHRAAVWMALVAERLEAAAPARPVRRPVCLGTCDFCRRHLPLYRLGVEATGYLYCLECCTGHEAAA